MKTIETGETIDITPTWSGILPVIIAAIENPGLAADARRNLHHELRRMALIADMAIAQGTLKN
jgi:hypothetical protein